MYVHTLPGDAVVRSIGILLFICSMKVVAVDAADVDQAAASRFGTAGTGWCASRMSERDRSRARVGCRCRRRANSTLGILRLLRWAHSPCTHIGCWRGGALVIPDQPFATEARAALARNRRIGISPLRRASGRQRAAHLSNDLTVLPGYCDWRRASNLERSAGASMGWPASAPLESEASLHLKRCCPICAIPSRRRT